MSMLSRLAVATFIVSICSPTGAVTARAQPGERPLKVAFVVSEGFTLIDFAGPWEVFNAARLPVSGADRASEPQLFETYAVSPTPAPVTAGLSHIRLLADYTFDNAPKPDLIVVGAQDWRHEIPGLMAWLRKQHASETTILSVCIGAEQLAQAGLLDGKQATTHHSFIEDFRKTYPKTTWLEGKRFVKSSETVWTGGGLTAGIDLALHIVAVRFGEPTAAADARQIEYTGTGWKQND
jgi:transcriptional regulator GlxA family with amidase domain